MHFIRHGQSEFNQAMNLHGRDPGIHDAPLTDKGREQARRAAERLAEHEIEHILCSPYTRALQTTEIIVETLKVPVTIEPLVAERALYSCDVGTPISVIRKKWGHMADFSAVETEHWWPQDCNESHSAVQKRVKAFHKKWGSHAKPESLLVVSHWYFINTLTQDDLENCENIFFNLSEV